MSKTPFTRKHREALDTLRNHPIVHVGVKQALSAALEHLPEPEPETLPDGPYLYTGPTGDITVRFIFDGKVTGWTTDHMDEPGRGSYAVSLNPEDHHRYEPIAIIRGDGGEVPADLVERVHRRVGMGIVAGPDRYTVRNIMQAILDEVRG